jgi:TonB-dependent receptor
MSQDRVYGNYKFWASASQRFFDDKFGVFVQGNMNRSDGGNQTAAVTPTLIGSAIDVPFGQGQYQTNAASFQYASDIIKNSGGSLILDYLLPDGKIVFQNTYAGNLTDHLNSAINLNFDNKSVVYTPDRSLYGKDLWINALQVEQNLGDMKIQASLAHSSTQQYTRFGYLGNNGAWSQFGNSSDNAPFGYDAQGKPVDYYGDKQKDLNFTSVLGIFNNLNPADAAGSTIQGWTQSIANQFKQHLYNGALDLTKPVSFSDDFTAIFKAGGKYVRTTRENNIDEDYAHGASDLYLNPEADAYLGGVSIGNPVKLTMVMNNDFKRGQYFLNDLYDFTNGGFKYTIDRNRYDKWLQLSEQGWLIPIHAGDTYKNDWNGAEQFSAGYIMGTFNIGPMLTILGGARFESYNMQYHAQFTFIQHNVYGNAISTENGSVGVSESPDLTDPKLKYTVPYNTFNVNRTDNNIFPNAQLKYDFNEWSDLRLAYTTGISRPDYTAIIPKVAFQDGQFELGNPLLKPSTAKNYDVITTFHNNYIGLLTINGFYKVIDNAMYFTTIYYFNRAQYATNVYVPDSLFLADRFGFGVQNYQTIQINLNNQNKGYIRGIEIDWQTNFWYLPGVFSSFVLDVNYTKSGSNTVYTVLTPAVYKIHYTDHGRDKTRDSLSTRIDTYSGRMIQQANDVLNIALGADYKGFHARLSFSLTGNVINSVGSRPEQSSYTGNIYRWDFTVKQELPIDGLSLSLNGMNIFHNGIDTYRNYKLKTDAPVTKNLVSVLYSPSLFEMNLRYSF